MVGIALAISPYTHTEGYNILAQKYVQPGGARGLAQRAAQRAPRHETSFKYPAPPSPIKYNRQTVKETSIVGDRLFKHTRTCQGDKTSTRYHISYTTQRLNEGLSRVLFYSIPTRVLYKTLRFGWVIVKLLYYG